MKNVTITLDEQTAARARVEAAERNMSLSRYIGEVLRRELRHDDEYEAAYRAWRARRPFLVSRPGERYPTREELHDRAALRREHPATGKGK